MLHKIKNKLHKLLRLTKLSKLSLNHWIYVFGGLALVLIIIFFFWWNNETVIDVKNDTGHIGQAKEETISSLAGLTCNDYDQRPLAVMLAGDREARPLSSLIEADMVFEMPVAPNGITRYMAVYQCNKPKEIGSIRSAREDFIPLAAGLKSIYTHWGGEHDALRKLDNKIMDNIDAMKFEGSTFYRKRGIPAPHDGFSGFELLEKRAKDLKYDLKDTFAGYPRTDKVDSPSLTNIASSINIGYADPFDVVWTFDSSSNTYKRIRSGKPELDKTNNQQISASVVVVMETKSQVISDQYISVNVTGEGTARVYQGGIVTNGKWRKDPLDIYSKLYFYGPDGQEIKFLPGRIWIEIVTR